MKILITGVAGFVGSSLCRKLLEDPAVQIDGVDNMSFGRMERCVDFIEQIGFFEESVQTFLKQRSVKYDLILNTAAIAPLPENQIDHERAISSSLGISAAIVDYCIRTGSDKIVHISSSAVYEMSGATTIPSKETDEVKPRLLYPLTKYLVEQYFEQQANLYGIDINCIRLFNLYGPHQDYFRLQPPLLGYLIRSAIKKDPITIYSKGVARRDYIYIDDLVDLIGRMMAHKSIGFKIYNAGSGTAYTVSEIIAMCERVFARQLEANSGDPAGFWSNYPQLFDSKLKLPISVVESEIEKNSISDNSKAYADFGWSASTRLEDGIRKCFDYATEIIQ